MELAKSYETKNLGEPINKHPELNKTADGNSLSRFFFAKSRRQGDALRHKQAAESHFAKTARSMSQDFPLTVTRLAARIRLAALSTALIEASTQSVDTARPR